MRPLDLAYPLIGWKPVEGTDTGAEAEALANRMNDAVAQVLQHAEDEEFDNHILVGAQVLFTLSNLGAAILTQRVERV